MAIMLGFEQRLHNIKGFIGVIYKCVYVQKLS